MTFGRKKITIKKQMQFCQDYKLYIYISKKNIEKILQLLGPIAK